MFSLANEEQKRNITIFLLYKLALKYNNFTVLSSKQN